MMLVFGDTERREAPGTKLDRIRALLSGDAVSPIGIVRHAALVSALIEAGELAQGLEDLAFAERGGVDARSAPGDAAVALTIALARCVAASWTSGFSANPALPSAEIAPLDGLALPAQVTTRQPEGYAHYCVYPEGYLDAASALAGQDVRVIGLRSIGTSLAAVVAAALGQTKVVTLRPAGHPFRRELAVDASLAAELAADPTIPRAIVDEGPGLSGSSVASVAAHLEKAGVDPVVIHLFPSHRNGPGSESSSSARAVWTRLPSHVTTFDALALNPTQPHRGLAAWVRDLVGDAVAPLRDISGGRWRALRYDSEAEWPPVLAWQERRKFLIDTASGTFLLKFAGLGRTGATKLDRARRLAEAGFSPEVVGWRHGFLVERWLAAATPLDLGTTDRPALVRRLGDYIAFRARHFPSERGCGAGLAALVEMALVNAREALGEAAADRLRDRLAGLERREALIRPVETDNRLHAWEWLNADGRLLKTDAVDHHAGHDLVGDQDFAWDIAGAAVELELTPAERETLTAIVEEESDRPQARQMAEAMPVLYRAFQLGYYTVAAATTDGAAERNRLNRNRDRYRAGLERELT